MKANSLRRVDKREYRISLTVFNQVGIMDKKGARISASPLFIQSLSVYWTTRITSGLLSRSPVTVPSLADPLCSRIPAKCGAAIEVPEMVL